MLVQRNDQVPSTTLRKLASTARTADVFLDGKPQVRNGQIVTSIRKEGEFTWVRCANGIEGFVNSAYLHSVPVPPPPLPVADVIRTVRRKDRTPSTMLRQQL